MKIKELIDLLESFEDGELEVRVKAMGGFPRGSVSIDRVLAGFDWERGSVVLGTVHPLELRQTLNKQREAK